MNSHNNKLKSDAADYAVAAHAFGISGGRKFAYFKTSEPEQWRFSIRTSPERFLELTDVPGIKPARYMAKFHWVTIVNVKAVPADYLQELIACSYTKAVTRTRKAAGRHRGEVT